MEYAPKSFAWLFRSAGVIAFLGLIILGNPGLALAGLVAYFVGGYVVEAMMLMVGPVQSACLRAHARGQRGRVIFWGVAATTLAGLLESLIVVFVFHNCLSNARGMVWMALLLAWPLGIGLLVDSMAPPENSRFGGLNVLGLVLLGFSLLMVLGLRVIPPWTVYLGFGAGRVSMNIFLWSLGIRETWKEEAESISDPHPHLPSDSD